MVKSTFPTVEETEAAQGEEVITESAIELEPGPLARVSSQGISPVDPRSPACLGRPLGGTY